MVDNITSPVTGRTFSIAELRKPRLFLREIVSYAHEDRVGAVDSHDHEPGVWRQGRERSPWEAWMAYDRRDGLPSGLLPERLYLATGLRSLSGLGDYSGRDHSAVKIVSQRFVEALREAGQPDVQIMPLTVWRRAEADIAPSPDAQAAFSALYCWCDPKAFDLKRSSLTEIDPGKYGQALTDDGLTSPSAPKVYAGTWQNLCPALDPSRISLPPMFRVSGVGKRRYLSPQFAERIEREKLKVALVNRPVDPDREMMIGDAFRRGLIEDWPSEHPLGG